MGTYIYGINRTKQHKTYGTIGVMNFLYKPTLRYSDESYKRQERTDERLLKRWATSFRAERSVITNNRWDNHYTYTDVPYTWAFPRVVAREHTKELYYFTGSQPIWCDEYEGQMVPLDKYIADGGIVELYDPATKSLTPSPMHDYLVG